MKIVFMGTPDFAAESLKALLDAGEGYEVTACVTQPDKKKGRGLELVPTPVKALALQRGIPVLQPANINTDEAFRELNVYPADIYVVAAFGQILKDNILNNTKYGCVNVHASLLPEYRGAAPIQRAILDGCKETGVTIMKMERGLDTGDMISKVVVPITGSDTGMSLHDKLAVEGGRLLVKTLADIESGTAQYVKQDDSRSSYAGRLDKAMGLIDWGNDAAYIERQIRALYPWPGAYTKLKGKGLKVMKAGLGGGTSGEGIDPGTVISVNKSSVEISTGRGSLVLYEVLPEGKKKMEMQAFLNGYRLSEGDHIGE